jgi:hypothetical protein
LGPPDVAVVETHRQYNTSQVSNETVRQSLEGHPKRRPEASNVVPVKAEVQKSHALITLRAAKQVREDKALLVC